jgi:hypothetical protein
MSPVRLLPCAKRRNGLCKSWSLGYEVEMLETIFYWLQIVVCVTMGIATAIFMPLGMFRRTRIFAGTGLIVASYAFGASLWAYGAIATFLYWGWIGLILGLVILGLGVVPMGFVALVLQSQWGLVASLGALLGLTFGARFLGAYCLSKEWKG